MSILEVAITKVPWFFKIFYSMVPKIMICLKYFFVKNIHNICISLNSFMNEKEKDSLKIISTHCGRPTLW